MKIYKGNIRNLVAVLLLVMVFSSCVPRKEMLYLKDPVMVSETISKDYVNERSINYKLQPGDNLYIRALNSVDERSVATLNGDVSTRSGSTLSSDASIYLNSYTLDEEGCIELPLTGKVELKNLTVEEAKGKLQTELNKYVNETMLIVKMSNFNLTILGEVNKPGMYKVYQSQINLFEALSMAGNGTTFAKNNAVKIIRQTPKGSEIITVDLGQADILESPYYYLKPNDIIYVEPLPMKQWGFSTFPYSTVISIVTLGITLFTLLKK